MGSKAQRKATKAHRRRAAARGLMRVEIQADRRDAPLLRAVAKTLRVESEKSESLRSTLVKVLTRAEVRTAFDVFGSDLPDETLSGVFDQPRQQLWRETNL